jgi:hypothetical protein
MVFQDVYVHVPQFLVEPLTMFCRTLVGKHCSRLYSNLTTSSNVQDTVNIMKTEGYKFPALKESDAMFSADTAPEWADGDVCHRCRVQFGMMQRKVSKSHVIFHCCAGYQR